MVTARYERVIHECRAELERDICMVAYSFGVNFPPSIPFVLLTINAIEKCFSFVLIYSVYAK